jgi:hypothetical protein
MIRAVILGCCNCGELGAGLALLAIPSIAVKRVPGSPLDAPAAVPLGPLAGAALFSLGVACWLAREGDANCAARGSIAAVTLCNVAAVAVLAYAGIGIGLRRHRMVAGGRPSRGDDPLVYRVPREQALERRQRNAALKTENSGWTNSANTHQNRNPTYSL